MAFVKRRLAFLVQDEAQFDAISRIGFRDYQGKFVVFYERERRGRLFEFVEGNKKSPKYRFMFADNADEVTTDKLVGAVIDAPLLRVFQRRVSGESATNGEF